MKAIAPPLPSYVWDDLAARLGLSTQPAHAAILPHQPRTPKAASGDIESLLKTPCKDGERTAHLTTLIGTLLAARRTPEQALAQCHQWNAQNIEPLDDQKVIDTFASILSLDQSNHPERYLAESQATPLLPLAAGRIDHFLSASPPPRKWLLNETIVLGKAGAIVAPGGSSKSQWLLQLAVAVATGLPVADHWHVSQPGNVIVLSAEDDEDEIHRRLKRIADHLTADGHDLAALGITKRLRVFSTIGIETLLTRRSASGEVSATAIAERIALMADEFKDVRLIVLDPASRFRGGEENSNEDATRFVEVLEFLAKRTGASVLIAHHTSKASYGRSDDASQGASRGASALTDGLRWQMNLMQTSDKQLQGIGLSKGQSKARYLTASVTKTNYTAFPEPVILERLDNGYLQVVNGSASQQRRMQNALLQVLQIVEAQPKPLTTRRLEDRYGGIAGHLQMPKHDLRSVVKTATTRGLLSGGDRKPLTLTAQGQATLQANRQAADGASRADAKIDRKKFQ